MAQRRTFWDPDLKGPCEEGNEIRAGRLSRVFLMTPSEVAAGDLFVGGEPEVS